MKKSDKNTQTLTIETRLPRGSRSDLLSDYARLFSRLSRLYFKQWSIKNFSAKQEDKPTKAVFLKEHGITGRQFNAIKVSVEGMVASQKSNLPRYLAECQAKIRGVKRVIEKKKKLISKHRNAERFDLLALQQLALQGKTRRLDCLVIREADLTKQIQENDIQVCFGSKSLFRKQFNLEKNNYQSHQQWLDDWQASREAQFLVLGSCDETGGSQGCTLFEDNDGYKLRLLLPKACQQNGEKYLWLDGITFPYLSEVIEQAVLLNRERAIQKSMYLKKKANGELPLVEHKKKGMIIQPEADFLSGLGQSLSYRFIKDKRGWRILVSTTLSKPLPVKDTSKGVIGIDFNQGFVSVAHINERGQKVSVFDLSYDTGLDATSRQNKTKIQEIALTIRDYARGVNLPIAIENLNFKRTKGSLQKRDNQQYNQMISALSYGIFKQAMAMQCFKYDIALIQVDPAFTSFIGRLKYGRETQFNTHQAAAWVIARRAMGLKEPLPKKSMIKCSKRVFDVFTAPEDALKTQQQALIFTSKAFSRWIITIIKAERLRVKHLDKFTAPLDDSLLNF